MKLFKYLIIMFLAVAAVSCSKDGGSTAVNVSVAPAELTAPYLLSSQSFEVQADGAWTAKIHSDAGEPIAWATLSREKGNGNARINVRVFDNEYKVARTARITVTSASGNKAVVTLTQSANPDSELDIVEATVRVGTFNVRSADIDEDDDNNDWENRKPRVIKSIQANDFDFFGVNEVTKDIAPYLTEMLKDKYELKYFNPYDGLSSKYAAQGLAYKKDKYTLSDWHVFYLSETPDRPSKNDGNHCRGGCCGVLTHKATGIKIFVMVTHGALDDTARDTYAHICSDMEKKYNTEGYPSFFVGDMNAGPTASATKTYLKHWKDAFLEAPERIGPKATFSSFNLNQDLNLESKRIDYVYFRNAVPLKYVCDDTRYDGYWPSDHFPIYADMKIKATEE